MWLRGLGKGNRDLFQAQSTVVVSFSSRSTNKDLHFPRDLMDESSGLTREGKISL